MQKLNSFTIPEVVISMLLAGIVTAFSYAGLQYYMNIFFRQHNNSRSSVELASFYEALSRDFDAADFVMSEGEGIRCVFAEREVKYSIEYDYILRYSEKVDTFRIRSSGIKRSFQGEVVHYEGEYIDYFQWELLSATDPVYITRRKDYASDFFYKMNRNGR